MDILLFGVALYPFLLVWGILTGPIPIAPQYISENITKPPKLLVFDTKTDKIIKTFEGNYFGISINPRY